MSDTVLAQIAALKTKSTPELHEMWRELFDKSRRPSAGATWRIGSPTAFRNCASAACPTGSGASSTPWPISSSPRPHGAATPAPAARHSTPPRVAGGRARRHGPGARLRIRWPPLQVIVGRSESDYRKSR